MHTQNRFFYLGFALILCAVLFTVLAGGAGFLLFLGIGITGTLFMFFTVFEKRSVSTEKIVLIALLSSLAAAGRVLFTTLPNVQPVSFLVILTGIAFGKEIGFLTGAVAALTSNLILGHGPWTLWQMFAWGLMGFVSALFSNRLAKSKLLLVLYSFLWGFLFGYIMNTWVLIGNPYGEINWALVVSAYTLSFQFDLYHGITNVLLILTLGKRFLQIFDRIGIKYGLSTIIRTPCGRLPEKKNLSIFRNKLPKNKSAENALK